MDKIIDCSNLDMGSYNKFINSKLSSYYEVRGKKIFIKDSLNLVGDVNDIKFSEYLFDYQKFIVKQALNKKKFAIFADCGLGKTAMFLEWVKILKDKIGKKNILIISPLSVIKQTINENIKFYRTNEIYDAHNENIENWVNNNEGKIGITNFEKFNKEFYFKDKIGAVVIDESSILKNQNGVIKNSLTNSFRNVPYKLCCTATPAPNDREEYANHAVFLDYFRSNNEFFSMFFQNTDNGWEVKKHSFNNFYKNLSEWSIYFRNPDKFGFINNIKNIPKPKYIEKDIEWTNEQLKYVKDDYFGGIKDIITKRLKYIQLSKGFINSNTNIIEIKSNKPKFICDYISGNKDDRIIIWTMYNKEEEILIKYLIENNITYNIINGSTCEEKRINILNSYRNNEFKVLITKPKILGFGVNLQFVKHHIFSGLSDSYEQFYQSIRRSYRYGSIDILKVIIPVTVAERKILENILNKKELFELDSEVQENYFLNNLQYDLKLFKGEKVEKKMTEEKNIKENYKENNWELILGDSIRVLEKMDGNSIDFSIFSPPFASLFTYSSELEDMGNSRDGFDEFKLHFDYFCKYLFKVIKEGKNVCCHVQQLSTYKGLDGFVGTKDFRGLVIERFQEAGFIFFGEFVIKKNPQAQAIRNKVRSLSFSQLESNRLKSRPGYNDFVLIFKKPGECNFDVNDETGPTRDEWINWATGVWEDIKESDTLNVKGTKSNDDVKHICPLQLEVIRRCIRLYTNKNDLILDPFNGIGSSGVVSLELGRKYKGIELKPEYYEKSIENLKSANILNLEDYKDKSKIKKVINNLDLKTKPLY